MNFLFDIDFSETYMGPPTATSLWAVGAPSGFRVYLENVSSLLRGGAGIGSFFYEAVRLRAGGFVKGSCFGGFLSGRGERFGFGCRATFFGVCGLFLMGLPACRDGLFDYAV